MSWFEDLGARFAAGSRFDVHFGDLQSEAAAVLGGTVISPLAHLGVIRASGNDVESFLQGQLSNDLRLLSNSRAQLSSYNSPKGRMLAVLHLFRTAEAVYLETHRSVQEATLKRLKMFVLRSKVALEDATGQLPAFGIAGPDAAKILRDAGLPAPEKTLDCGFRQSDGITIIRRAGPDPRFTLHAPSTVLRELWPALAANARPVGTAAWRLLEIRAGVPTIYPETQDHFVAQMANLDRLGGISFDKGCYTGQEVVARLHYLGNLKRRTYLLHTGAPAAEPGTPIYDAGAGEQSVGEVVDSAPQPDGQLALLAVLQTSHAESGLLRLGSAEGPTLSAPATLDY